MTIFQDKLLTRTDCDEAGNYVVPNVLSLRDLVFRPAIEDKLYHHHELGCKNLSTGFLTRSDTNPAAEIQMSRGVKFRIYKVNGWFCLCRKKQRR